MKANHAVAHSNPALLSLRNMVALALALVSCSSQTPQACRAQVAAMKQADPTDTVEVVSLHIAHVLGAAGTTLAFTVVNNSKAEINTRHFNSNFANATFLITPEGKGIPLYPEGDDRPFLIKPGESFTWKDDIQQVFRLYDMKNPGLYKIHWRLADIKEDKEVKIYKAEAFILKEVPAEPGK